MINGNGNSKVLKVLYQNIPGYTLNNEDIIASIELILDQEKPDVLGIAEPKYNDLERDWDGYTLVKGSLKNGTKIRLNALIRNSLVYETFEWKTDVPMIGLRVENEKIVLVYREWNLDGNRDTNQIPSQVDRWKNFLEEAAKLKGKNCHILGDVNYEYWKVDTPHQRKLEPLRELTRDYLIADGWIQVVVEDTRVQRFKGSKETQRACLDHIYCKSSKTISLN